MRLRDRITNWIHYTFTKFESDVDLAAAIDTLLHSNRVRNALRGMFVLYLFYFLCIHYVFTGINRDYVNAVHACNAIKDTLAVLSISERYSGVSRGILQALVDVDSVIRPTAEMLGVSLLLLFWFLSIILYIVHTLIFLDWSYSFVCCTILQKKMGRTSQHLWW